MTKHAAKELTLLVWEYLEKHPRIGAKCQMPLDILDKVRDYPGLCTLCAWIQGQKGAKCGKCPLGVAEKECGPTSVFPWHKWAFSRAGDWKTRKEAAHEIVSIVEAWDTEVKE